MGFLENLRGEISKIILTLLSVVILTCSWQTAFAKTKIKKGYYALVIGNSDYTDQSVSTLGNAVNDAKAISAALRRLGFTVIYGENLTYEGMRKKTREFFQKASKMEVGLFYYSGHGIQIKSQNFLIPVNANFSSNTHFHKSVVSISSLVDHIDHNSKSGLIFLDACRDNPFRKKFRRSAQIGLLKMTRSIGQILRIGQGNSKRSLAKKRGFYPEKAAENEGTSETGGSGGVAQEKETASIIDISDLGNGLAKIDAGDGMLISFATRPGETALDGKQKHSPFTAGLLKYIEDPALLIEQVLSRVGNHVKKLTGGTQVPWMALSLTTDLRLASLAPPERGVKRPRRKPGSSRIERKRTQTKRKKKGVRKKRRVIKTARKKRVRKKSTRRPASKRRSSRSRLDSPTMGIGIGSGGP